MALKLQRQSEPSIYPIQYSRDLKIQSNHYLDLSNVSLEEQTNRSFESEWPQSHENKLNHHLANSMTPEICKSDPITAYISVMRVPMRRRIAILSSDDPEMKKTSWAINLVKSITFRSLNPLRSPFRSHQHESMKADGSLFQVWMAQEMQKEDCNFEFRWSKDYRKFLSHQLDQILDFCSSNSWSTPNAANSPTVDFGENQTNSSQPLDHASHAKLWYVPHIPQPTSRPKS